MTKDELKMVLGFVESINLGSRSASVEQQRQVVTAIKEALAQPEQEPLFKKIIEQHPGLAEELKAMDDPEQELAKYSDYEPDGVHHNKPEQNTVQRLSALVRAQQITIDKLEAQSEQEPLAWYDSKTGWTDFHSFKPARKPSSPDAEWLPLYSTPPQRKPLTDEQWQVIADTLDCFITRSQKDIIEAKLKENT